MSDRKPYARPRIVVIEPLSPFHAHLEGCEQCAADLFNLCEAGAAILATDVRVARANADGEQEP